MGCGNLSMIFSAEDMLGAEEYYPVLFLVEAVECNPFSAFS